MAWSINCNRFMAWSINCNRLIIKTIELNHTHMPKLNSSVKTTIVSTPLKKGVCDVSVCVVSDVSVNVVFPASVFRMLKLKN